MITNTFTIYPDQLIIVSARLAKMNKKALKLGIKPAELTSVERCQKSKQFDSITGKTREVLTPVLDITVTGQEIKYGNYTHVASLDHTVGENPIVNVVPNESIPAIYQTAKAVCEHCNSARSRKNTFIFREGDQYKQVGSSCLKEFFGIDPTQKLNWFADLSNMDLEFVGNGRPEFLETNRRLLAIGLAVVERFGYVSSKQASDTINSTTDEVKYVMYPPMGLEVGGVEYVRGMRERAEELLPKADEMIAWGIEKFAKEASDYAHNLSIFLKSEYTKLRYYGYTISLIAAYNKEVAENLAKGATRSDNAYIGTVGDKVTTDVIVNKVIAVDGNYGLSYINIMTEQESGNHLVWVSSNKVLDDNDVVKIKGSIKALNVREGKNQTILTRCKVI